jgi:S-DNA-T family DNA segregation ATPase FtsK/SpoIIIE
VTATRSSSSRKGGPAKKAPAKKAPAKKAASSRSRAGGSRPSAGKRKPPPPPSRWSTFTDALGEASRGHGADFAGLLLAVIGLVAGLGIYADAGGPVGRAVADVMGALFGAARVVAPPLFVLLGGLLVRGIPEADPDAEPIDGAPTHAAARLVLGGTLLGIAAIGILHLVRGAPGFDVGRDEVADAAGYVGRMIGGPLDNALGQVGAYAVLVALGVAGALVVTRTTIRTVASRTAAGVAAGARPVGGAARRAYQQLFDLRDGAEGEPSDEVAFQAPSIEPPDDQAIYDQDEGEPVAPAKPKRPRPTPTTRRSSWRSISRRAPRPRPGSCRRPACSTGRGASRSTARRSRRPGAASSTRSPSTGSRPGSWA